MIEFGNCSCLGWARVFENDGLPISHHHPKCQNYIEEEFVKISADGGSCIVELSEQASFEDGVYIKTLVRMTRDQFENLPESEGF